MFVALAQASASSFEPYPQEVFERTRRWIESWDLFPPEQKGSAGYEIAVV
jgi:hypothetical protein